MIASISGRSCQVRKFTHGQFRSKLYDVPIPHCIPLSGRQALHSQNHQSDDHRASSDEEDGWLPTRPHMSLPIDMPVHRSKSYPADGPIKPSLVTNLQAPPSHVTAPTDVPPEPPRVLVTPGSHTTSPTPWDGSSAPADTRTYWCSPPPPPYDRPPDPGSDSPVVTHPASATTPPIPTISDDTGEPPNLWGSGRRITKPSPWLWTVSLMLHVP